MPLFWTGFILGIGIIVLFYMVFFYDGFEVREVKIVNNQKVESENVKRIVLENLPRTILPLGIFNITSKNIFIIDTQKIVQEIKNKIPTVGEVTIKKEFPNGLMATITERQPAAVFCGRSLEECFFIDNNGVIFEMLSSLPEDIIILERNEGDENYFEGKNVFSKNIMDIVYKINKNLEDNFQIKVKKALVSNPLIFETIEGWKVYFNPDTDIDLQLTKLNALLNDTLDKETRREIHYIYLQYKDRAYYK